MAWFSFFKVNNRWVEYCVNMQKLLQIHRMCIWCREICKPVPGFPRQLFGKKSSKKCSPDWLYISDMYSTVCTTFLRTTDYWSYNHVRVPHMCTWYNIIVQYYSMYKYSYGKRYTVLNSVDNYVLNIMLFTNFYYYCILYAFLVYCFINKIIKLYTSTWYPAQIS